MSGHLAYTKLVIALFDGRVRLTAEDDLCADTDCGFVVADDWRDGEMTEAA